MYFNLRQSTINTAPYTIIATPGIDMKVSTQSGKVRDLIQVWMNVFKAFSSSKYVFFRSFLLSFLTFFPWFLSALFPSVLLCVLPTFPSLVPFTSPNSFHLTLTFYGLTEYCHETQTKAPHSQNGGCISYNQSLWCDFIIYKAYQKHFAAVLWSQLCLISVI